MIELDMSQLNLNTLTPRGGDSPGSRIVTADGRRPWYNVRGDLKDAFIIGITGGSASGKTSVAKAIIEELGVRWVVLLSQDSFYKPLGPEEVKRAHDNKYDFDIPDAFDYRLMVETLGKLKKGKQVDIPIYDFEIHNRLERKQTVYGASVILFEGILTFADEELRNLMDLKIFVDTDSDIRLARRMKRDISERGRDVEGVLRQYNAFVKPSFEKYILPTRKYADMIVPRGSDNVVAIDLIVQHVQRKLDERGFQTRQEVGKSLNQEELSDRTVPDTVDIMPPSQEQKAMHTIIRDKETDMDDFIFYTKRLMRLLLEHTLSIMPHHRTTITTPNNHEYVGMQASTTPVGVSIVRAGVPMEQALTDLVKDVPLGRLLIQSDEVDGEPRLHHAMLPKDLANRPVVLMDATIASGAAAMMAIRVLLDHEVEEHNIFFAALIASPLGVRLIHRAFPAVHLCVSEIDDGLNESFWILPGLGNFGNRYFGT